MTCTQRHKSNSRRDRGYRRMVFPLQPPIGTSRNKDHPYEAY